MLQHKTASIDGFRIIAMLMVIVIHTGPLHSFSESADFVLTRVLCRVAVPFFFMVSGYFVLGGEGQRHPTRVKRYLKKTALCYGAAILLYLPLNWYMGDFNGQKGAWDFLKAFLFNGTVYHLWYLPAAIIGIIIAALLIQKAGMTTALIISGMLYAVALGGDSYYGLVSQIPAAQAAYDALFRIFDYTRNGLLMAPLFFVLGAWIAQKPLPRLRTSLVGTVAALIVMTGEALTLHRFSLQRHDSMYVLLPIVMVFLFSALLSVNNAQNRRYRTVSLLGYILHLWVIVGVRRVAERLGLVDILVRQSLVHFLVVAVLSLMISFCIAWLYAKMRRKEKPEGGKCRAWIEVDLDAIVKNVDTLRRLLPNKNEVMAVIKANAYGHGDVAVAQHLYAHGVRAFAVATLDEAIALRKARVKDVILILGYTAPSQADLIVRYDLVQTICDADHARILNDATEKPIRTHIKIDTGMHRLGQSWEDIESISDIFELPNLRVEGLFSHLCVCDSQKTSDVAFTQLQIDRFWHTTKQLGQKGFDTGKLHIQSSYGAACYPNLPCDYARIGIMMYGVASSPHSPLPDSIDLKPALSLKARIACLRQIPAGETVGYGRACCASKDAIVAIISIGYADGVPRNYGSTGAYVLVRGERAPVVGRICMDQLIVDVSTIEDVAAGDIVTLIGRDGQEEIRCEDFAEYCETITNEVLSRLGRRLKRVY